MIKELDFEISPSEMAEIFWNMDDIKQAEFFVELHKIINEHYKTNKFAHSIGALQWRALGQRLENTENKNGKDMLMALAAPLYLHTLMHCEGLSI